MQEIEGQSPATIHLSNHKQTAYNIDNEMSQSQREEEETGTSCKARGEKEATRQVKSLDFS